MDKYFKHTILLALFTIIVAACTSTPTPTLSPTTPDEPVAKPTDLPPTAEPPATATNPPPTTTSPTKTATIEPSDNEIPTETNMMNIQIGDQVLTATLAENSSADALKAALAKGPITIDMRDYGSMEKVGSLGMDLPRNDEQITTEAGDIILFQGSAFVIYYAPNSWNFTRLGKVNDLSAEELKEILGDGNVTITLSLAEE